MSFVHISFEKKASFLFAFFKFARANARRAQRKREVSASEREEWITRKRISSLFANFLRIHKFYMVDNNNDKNYNNNYNHDDDKKKIIISFIGFCAISTKVQMNITDLKIKGKHT